MDVIEQAWRAYAGVVCDYAEEQFTQVVKPWLKERGLNFWAVNGMWGLTEHEDDGSTTAYYLPWDDDKVQMPDHVRKVLEMEIPGLPTNDLGSLMPEYDFWVDVANNGGAVC